MAGRSLVRLLYRRDHHTGFGCFERPHLCLSTMAWDFTCLGNQRILRCIQYHLRKEAADRGVRGPDRSHNGSGRSCCPAVGAFASRNSH